MKKEEVAKQSVALGPKILLLNTVKVEFKNKQDFNGPNISSIFIPESYTIVFNKDWLIEAKLREIIICSLHEIRHVYQKDCIDYKEFAVNEDPITIEKWKEEFSSCSSPNNELDIINNEYLEQEI